MEATDHRTFGLRDISWKQAPYILASGACMGTADVVPGVSGGTMAIALGIYQRLLAAIASVNITSMRALLKLDWRRALTIFHFRFIVCLLSGIFAAVVVMLKVVRLPELLKSHPVHVYALFFGLVLASCWVLKKRAGAFGAPQWLLAFVGAAVGFGVVNLVPVDTPDHPIFLFFCGMAGISAMLLPGISGSFILLILGKYAAIMEAIGELLHFRLAALSVVLPFALGCAVGIAVFARFLSWLMYRWQGLVMATMLGLLLGTLWRIWPYQLATHTVMVRGKERVLEMKPFLPESLDWFVLGLGCFGLALVLVVEHLAERRRSQDPLAAGQPEVTHGA
jgi:putative membrane protein